MTKYAQAALDAMRRIKNGEMIQLAWESATIDLFGKGTSGQKKGCPKHSFLGLCEAGLIEGIPKGKYSNKENSRNKGYAIKAVELIRGDCSKMNNKMALWQEITDVKPNHQLDVVFVLIENGYIKKK
jgi:hypothetical protein